MAVSVVTLVAGALVAPTSLMVATIYHRLFMCQQLLVEARATLEGLHRASESHADRVRLARRQYDLRVRDYAEARRAFPTVLLAWAFEPAAPSP